MISKNQAMFREFKSEVGKQLTDLISNSPNWSSLSINQRKLFVKQFLATYMQSYVAATTLRRQEDLANGVKFG